MSKQLAQQVENDLNELISRYQRLMLDHKALQNEQQQWREERRQLLQKNEIASTRIAALLPRLKELESATE